jgi:outer membrane protein assembly factor BamB
MRPNTIGRQIFHTIALAFLFGAISACSSGPFGAVGGLFGGGGGDDDETNAPPEDERISILTLDQQLRADPRYAGVAVQVPDPYVNQSWTQPGGEPDHTLHHVDASLELEKSWVASVGNAPKRAQLTSPPIVVADRLFVMDADATVTAFDSETGARVWRTELAPKIKKRFRISISLSSTSKSQMGFGGGVAFDQGRIFVTSGFGFVCALDALTGEELWRVETSAPVRTPPTAYREKVYITTITNEFRALDQATGENSWTYQSFEEQARILSSASPAAAGDLVVAPFSSGEVVAFLADSGQSVWNETLVQQTRLTALASLNDIAGSPVIDRGFVFVISHGGRIAAIDIRSGAPIWEASIAGAQMPWVAGDFLYVVSVDGELVCIARSDGGVIWMTQLQRYKNEKKSKRRIAWAGPVLAGGHLVLVSSEGKIIKVSPVTGEIAAEENIGEGSVISPIVANKKVYVLTEQGKVIAMR